MSPAEFHWTAKPGDNMTHNAIFATEHNHKRQFYIYICKRENLIIYARICINKPTRIWTETNTQMCILDISFPRHGGNKAPKSQICPLYVFTLQTIYLKRRLQNRTHHLWLPASPFLWVFIVCESCRWKQDFMRTLLVHVLTRPTDRHIFRRSDVPAVFTCRHLCMGCIGSVLCLYLNAVRRVLFFTLCGY